MDYKWLKVEDGNVLVLGDCSPDQARDVLLYLEDTGVRNVIAVLGDPESIRVLPEDEMKELGWVRKDADLRV